MTWFKFWLATGPAPRLPWRSGAMKRFAEPLALPAINRDTPVYDSVRPQFCASADPDPGRPAAKSASSATGRPCEGALAMELSRLLLRGGERRLIDLPQGVRARLIAAPDVGRMMREALQVPVLKI